MGAGLFSILDVYLFSCMVFDGLARREAIRRTAKLLLKHSMFGSLTEQKYDALVTNERTELYVDVGKSRHDTFQKLNLDMSVRC